MRYILGLLVGTSILVDSSPAPQPFDFASVGAAPSPSLTGPAFGVASQIQVYNQAAAISSASAGVTAVATPTPSPPSRRDLEARWGSWPWGNDDGCDEEWHWRRSGDEDWGWPDWDHTKKACTKTTTTTTTSASACSKITSTTTSTSVATSTTSMSSQSSTVPSTCTPVSWTNTNTYTTVSSCPTPYEVGTYCGFVNPEDPCAPQPGGYGPHVSPDTVAAFESYEPFQKDALDAVTPTTYVETFKDLNASVNANTYLGYETLKSYDVEGCATFCDNTNLCTGFNIYIERDPSINPDQCSCTNPASITNYKCSIWGSGVDAAAATNYGQTRDNFQVVIAASNGYEKTNNTTPPTPPGWTNPQGCSGAAHSHPSTCIGQKFFPGPFDVEICAAYAEAQNKKNEEDGSQSWWSSNYSRCNFFNAYMLTKNGVPKGTYCSLFSEQYDPSSADYVPGWNGDVYWGVESSWSFCIA